MIQIEALSVVLSLVFLYLLIQRNIWCWIFGILSSALSVYLFYQSKLYSESVLYLCYTVLGAYGWYVWDKAETNDRIIPIQSRQVLFALLIGSPLAIAVGILTRKFTDAAMPILDAITSVFGLIATYLEAHKYLLAWIFWIILNCITIGLYYSRDLKLYAGLMIIYFIVSIYGYVSWRTLLKN